MVRIVVAATLLVALAAPPALAGGAIGILGGINRANLSGDTPPHTSYNTRTGLALGVVGEVGLATDVLLQLTPMYVERGTKLERASDSAEGDSEIHDLALDYFSLPVLIKLLLGNGVTYVCGGLDLAFLLNAEIAEDGNNTDVSRVVQDTDLGAVFAFGVQFDLGAPQLALEARYTQSILNVAAGDAGEDESDVPVRFRSTGLQLLVGLLLPLGK